MSNNLPPGFPPGMTFNFFNGNGLDPLQFQSGIDSNNSAVAAALSGQTDVAIARHREALKMKLRVHGPNAIITAITYNGLGESLLEAGELQEAEEMLLNAYRVREGSGNGDNFDAAVTRENLGRLYEAKGDWARARSVRMEGSTRGRNSFACSNDKVRFLTRTYDRQLTLDAYSALDRLSLCRG